MLLQPRAWLELPLKVLIRQDSAGRTVVSYHPISEALGALGLPPALVDRLTPAQALHVIPVVHPHPVPRAEVGASDKPAASSACPAASIGAPSA